LGEKGFSASPQSYASGSKPVVAFGASVSRQGRGEQGVSDRFANMETSSSKKALYPKVHEAEVPKTETSHMYRRAGGLPTWGERALVAEAQGRRRQQPQ